MSVASELRECEAGLIGSQLREVRARVTRECMNGYAHTKQPLCSSRDEIPLSQADSLRDTRWPHSAIIEERMVRLATDQAWIGFY